jgi:RNA polymerase sigma-70 factor (ECF subfamily)
MIEVHVLPLERALDRDSASDLADRDEIERGFRQLSADQRAVLVLHHYLGMRTPEIAEILGIPVGTVHSRLHYAATAMRAVLEADARSAVAGEWRTA